MGERGGGVRENPGIRVAISAQAYLGVLGVFLGVGGCCCQGTPCTRGDTLYHLVRYDACKERASARAREREGARAREGESERERYRACCRIQNDKINNLVMYMQVSAVCLLCGSAWVRYTNDYISVKRHLIHTEET